MKRALAERAKQSGLPNGVAPATPAPSKPIPTVSSSQRPPSSQSPALNSSSSTSKAPLKIERHEGNASSALSQRSPRNSSTSPRPKKRMRESVVKLEEEDEDDSNASAFYLRHQNRALASELRSLKYMLSRLERERDYRRSQCTQAVQSLNALQATWTQMEAALQCGQPPPPQSDSAAAAPAMSSAPVSTGSGMSVELIGALLDSLAALGTMTPSKSRRRKNGGDELEDTSSAAESEVHSAADAMEVEVAEKQHLDDLLRITDNVAKRAATLQRWIWSLLQRVEGSPDVPALESSEEAQQQILALKAKNKSLKAKLKEVARSRDEMCDSEKRVRRGLYRLAAGRVQLKEVLKAIATSDEDKEAAVAWMEAPQIAPVLSTSAVSIAKASVSEKSESAAEDGTAKASSQNAEIHKQIADLEEVASARDEQIKQLLAEREDHVKRINALLLKDESKTDEILPDHAVLKSDLYAQMSVKLASSERKTEELEKTMSKMKEEWSAALADGDLARTSMEEMQSKHMKRWAELSGENGESDEAQASKTKADEYITLQHKLTQALEIVRQAETTKQTLHEAVTMNESLQAKLEEIRSKYTALQAGRSGGTNSSGNHTSSSSGSGGVTTPKPKASSSSSSNSAEKADRHEKEKSEKSEKLHRDYRRVRKELAAATASKEAAKAKLERTEKERDSLNQTNSRLLRQASEKDEMNAKSLSTILHLKQLTEQITKEKENLEQQVKSSQQVALAARLAANARERVTEEFEKDRKEMESKVREWEQKCAELSADKETLDGKIVQENAKMTALLADAEKARTRCEELVSESTKLQEEKQQMMESLAVAQREAAEAASITQKLAKQSGGGALPSGFTAEQLNTQVSVLKSRLACPVCNHRDKKCILLRCRHMFCKQCVDENIKNRSRKCPACGGRFDTKDVADVWL